MIFCYVNCISIKKGKTILYIKGQWYKRLIAQSKAPCCQVHKFEPGVELAFPEPHRLPSKSERRWHAGENKVLRDWRGLGIRNRERDIGRKSETKDWVQLLHSFSWLVFRANKVSFFPLKPLGWISVTC